MTSQAGSVLVATAEGAVVTMRIQRPEAENRLNLAVLRQLLANLALAETDPQIKVVVLTGSGDTFCCGGDVAEFAAGDAAAYRDFGELFAGLHLAILRLTKPVLAAVNGDARAGGLSLLAACDLAVARASARFAMPEVHAGLWPIMAQVLLNRELPRKRAFELYYFGEPFGAEEAHRLGLVNWIAPDGEFEDAVRRRAQALAAVPGSAVRIGRSTFAGIAERSIEEGFRYSADRLMELLTDPEVVCALAGRRKEAR